MRNLSSLPPDRFDLHASLVKLKTSSMLLLTIHFESLQEFLRVEPVVCSFVSFFVKEQQRGNIIPKLHRLLSVLK